jgi:hypothetical protein
MVFRVGERRTNVRGAGARIPEVAIAEALRSFGTDVDPQPDGTLVIGDHQFSYDPSAEPHFVLVPECDTCGTRDPEQFPLETWNLSGVPVRGQARASCRDCRFIALANR